MPQFPRRTGRLLPSALFLFLVGLGAFLLVVADVARGSVSPSDRLLVWRAHLLATSPDGRWLTPLAHLASMLANWQALLPLAGAFLILAWRRALPWRFFLFYIVACVGCGVLTLGFKLLIGRPRPELVPSLEAAPFTSFPSGHAMYALVAYGFTAYVATRLRRLPVLVRRAAPVAAVLLALAAGASRVYLATHYPSDVAAGFLIGVSWLVAVIVASRRWGRCWEARLRRWRRA